jgi:Domain of unknown function (DUF5919)
MSGPGGEVIDLRTRLGYRLDLASLARDQITQAREHLQLDAAAFADVLATLLGWTPTAEMIDSWETTTAPPGDVLVAASIASRGAFQPTDFHPGNDLISELVGSRFADVTAIYASRSEFAANMPAHSIFDGALDVKAAGLSLNMLCQQYADDRLARIVTDGGTLRCLFLDPEGDAIKTRELEEGYPAGTLSTLTALNIQILLRRVRDRLPSDRRDALRVATYDEPIRFNVMIIDGELCIMQPYMREVRGVDSPTFVIQKRPARSGLFPIFDEMFNAMWDQGRRL